jgi:predicted Zn-dependent protease
LEDQSPLKKSLFPSKISLQDISIEEKLKLVIDLDKQAKEFDARIINTNSSYADFVGEQLLLNSFGSQLTMNVNFIRISSVNYAFEAGIRQRGYESVGGQLGLNSPNRKRP